MSRDGRPRRITLALLAASNLLYLAAEPSEALPERESSLDRRVASVRAAASELADITDSKARMRAALSAAAKKRGIQLDLDLTDDPNRLAQWFNWFNWNNWNNWNNWGNWSNWYNWGNWHNM